MIVDDFDVRSTTRAAWPNEADSPLLVDPDAELAHAIPLQGFEPIASQCAKFIQADGGVENFEATISLPGKALKFTNEASFGERLGARVPVAQDHRETE
jgi:hypothetical protein